MKRITKSIRNNLLNERNRKKSKNDLDVEEKITPLECILYVEMKSVWKMFRLLGALPYVEVRETGNIVLHWSSTSMLYSLIMAIILSYLVIDIIRYRMGLIAKLRSDFDVQIYHMLNILIVAPSLIIPVYWINTKDFVEYVRSFAKFETDYYRITKTKIKIKINVKNYCLAVLIAIFLYLTLDLMSSLIGLRDTGGTTWYQQIAYFHAVAIFYVGLPYFGFMSHILIKLHENLELHFANVLSNPIKSHIVQEYRSLYCQLRSLSSRVISIILMGFAVYMITFLITVTFGTMTFITIAMQGNLVAAAMNVLNLGVLYLCLGFIIYRCHVLEVNGGQKFISNFFRSRNVGYFYGEEAASEIKIFIKMLKVSDIKVSGGGYFNVNHSSVISIVSLMSTYIIILIQFRAFDELKTLNYNSSDTDLELGALNPNRRQ